MSENLNTFSYFIASEMLLRINVNVDVEESICIFAHEMEGRQSISICAFIRSNYSVTREYLIFHLPDGRIGYPR